MRVQPVQQAVLPETTGVQAYACAGVAQPISTWSTLEMAHELSIDAAGNAEAMFADKGAWHKRGITVIGAFSAQDAMEQVIPWDALECALKAAYPPALAAQRGQAEFSVPHKAIIRSDTGAVIGVVGSDYTSIQPRHMFDFSDKLIEGSGFHYESAGALRGGSVLFISARVGSIDVLQSGDITRTYLAFINSFDGSLAAQAYLTGTRIVCMNTLQMSLGNVTGNALRFKHTKNVHNRMDAASKLVTGVLQTQEQLQTKLELLAQRKIVKREKYTAILDNLFPGDSKRTENIKNDITALWSDNDHNAYPDWKGTGYALYNAVTNYVDHSRSTRGEDKDVARAESAILGSGAALKERALEQILHMTDGTEQTLYVSAGIPESGSSSLLDDILAATPA